MNTWWDSEALFLLTQKGILQFPEGNEHEARSWDLMERFPRASEERAGARAQRPLGALPLAYCLGCGEFQIFQSW